MRWLVLPLAVLALGVLGLVLRGDDGNEPAAAPRTKTTAEPVVVPSDPADRDCGRGRGRGGHLVRIEVIGDVRCREARGVVGQLGEARATGPWRCSGSDRITICSKGSGSIRRRFLCRDWAERDRVECLERFGPP